MYILEATQEIKLFYQMVVAVGLGVEGWEWGVDREWELGVGQCKRKSITSQPAPQLW